MSGYTAFRITISAKNRNSSCNNMANSLNFPYPFRHNFRGPNLDLEGNYRYNNRDIKNIIDVVEILKIFKVIFYPF